MKLSRPARAKRSLGQNFLSDPNYIRKIIDAVGPTSDDTIIEIGPGRGALTEGFISAGAKVVAVELDRDLIAPLTEKFSGAPNFYLVEGDALEVDFGALASRPAKLAANLPYYISTAILQRLGEQRRAFTSLVLMFQKEVVERITAAPGNSERGYLTVITEMAFDVEKLFDVPASAFWPAPKVKSGVVRLTPSRLDYGDEEGLGTLLAASFRQKRKTLFNNLRSVQPDISKALKMSGIDGARRAESLTLDEWFRLNEALRH